MALLLPCTEWQRDSRSDYRLKLTIRQDKALRAVCSPQERKILLPTTVQLPSCSSRTAEEQRKNLVTSASVVDWLLSGCVVGRQFNAI